jgi:hypothetical protein
VKKKPTSGFIQISQKIPAGCCPELSLSVGIPASRRGSLGACRSTTAKFLPAEKSARPVSSRLLEQQPKSGISVLGKKLFPSDQEETQEFFASTERAQIMQYNIYAILDVMQLHLGGVLFSAEWFSRKETCKVMLQMRS